MYEAASRAMELPISRNKIYYTKTKKTSIILRRSICYNLLAKKNTLRTRKQEVGKSYSI
jgi:hypothetical protein